MPLLKATLIFVKRKSPLTVATALAELEADDIDFLGRHVEELRKAAGAQDALLSRFQHGSGIDAVLKSLLDADDAKFVDVSADFARQLQESMDQTSKPSPGVLAVIVTGPDEKPDVVSVLKLDAINEAAGFKFVEGQVKHNVLRDLLPAPGQLQKGISWPDPRAVSDTIVIDRNQAAAHYFFSAFDLEVSATPREAERALGEAINTNIPRSKRAAAMQYAAKLTGPADQVAAQVKAQYPELQIDRKELGADGGLGGYIRPNKIAAHNTRFRSDGIVVVVPAERLKQVSGPKQVGGGWEMTIKFKTRPTEDST